MKREDLFQAIGEVDEDLLDENIIVVKRKNIFPAVISAVACVAIVAGAVWIMPQKIPSDNSQIDTSEIQMETLAETMMNYDAPPVETAEISKIDDIQTQAPLVAESHSELLTKAVSETETILETEETALEPDGFDEVEDFTQIHYPLMPAFVHGKYQAVGESGEIRYFWFYDDGSGRFESEETGMGLGFTLDYLEVYNEDGTTDAIFHIGSIDDNTFVKIAHGENDTLIVKWQDGTEEIFTYLGESDE